MKLTRLLSITFFLSCGMLLKAQSLVDHHGPVGQNVRLAWAIDANGGTDGDNYSGFEVAYASPIYPLDQMLITYGHSNPNGISKHYTVLAVEEYYPICEVFKFYGTAGLGYMWTDFGAESGGDSTGWMGKIGGGGIFILNDAFDLYAELAYYASDRDLWLDGDDAVDSTNWSALLGFRFKY